MPSGRSISMRIAVMGSKKSVVFCAVCCHAASNWLIVLIDVHSGLLYVNSGLVPANSIATRNADGDIGGGGGGAGGSGGGGSKVNSRKERTLSQPGVGRDSHSYPHTITLLSYVYLVPLPPVPVATSTPHPSDTRMKSSPLHVSIQIVGSEDIHSLPQYPRSVPQQLPPASDPHTEHVEEGSQSQPTDSYPRARQAGGGGGASGGGMV